MPDARFPDRWLNDRRILRLAPEAFRSFVMSLTWSVSNRTDGRIEAGDLALIPGMSDAAVDALERAELWCPAGDGWVIVDFDATQTSKAQLEGLDHRRHQDRERQAAKRARDRQAAGQPTTDDPAPAAASQQQARRVSRDSSSDRMRDVASDVHRDTKARQGQDRQGQALRRAEHLRPTPDPWDDVEVAVPGGRSR